MGGSTSSYREVEDAEVILLFGSNARETHPIYFQHVLAGVRKGASFAEEINKSGSERGAQNKCQR